MTTCPGCGMRLHPYIHTRDCPHPCPENHSRRCPYHWGTPPPKTNAERVAEILAWAETPPALRVWPPVGR